MCQKGWFLFYVSLDIYIVYGILVQFSPEYIIKGTFFLFLKKQNTVILWGIHIIVC